MTSLASVPKLFVDEYWIDFTVQIKKYYLVFVYDNCVKNLPAALPTYLRERSVGDNLL